MLELQPSPFVSFFFTRSNSDQTKNLLNLFTDFLLDLGVGFDWAILTHGDTLP